MKVYNRKYNVFCELYILEMNNLFGGQGRCWYFRDGLLTAKIANYLFSTWEEVAVKPDNVACGV